MAERTIRQLVRDMQIEIRDSADLQVDRAADMLVKLAAIMGDIGNEQLAADLALAQVEHDLYAVHQAYSRAKLFAKLTPEYLRHREVKNCGVLATELIRSLKMFLRTKSEERQWSGHQ